MPEPGTPPVIGIIGGSGIYEIAGLRDAEWRVIESPFGSPSDALLFGELDGQRLVFLPRHGRGHRLPPSGLNFRANIDALKRAGATEIVSLSAVGSLREDLAPGAFVIVDQFIDRTFAREKTFFGAGMVAHVSVADPVCARLGDALESAGGELGHGVRPSVSTTTDTTSHSTARALPPLASTSCLTSSRGSILREQSTTAAPASERASAM